MRKTYYSRFPIVCLGNGVSVKEARFALHGANLCLSDLSISAVVALRRLLQPLGHNDKITYCSIDAYTLPFADNTVDIVYGFGFVHHLNDKVTFLHETLRVLKKGGMCIFFDDAYSPFWHTLKTTLLRPLMKYSHRKTGISPEDIRATYEGGFREKEIQRLGKICGFEDEYFFHRSELLGYLWIRGMQKLFYLSRNQQFFSIPAHIFAYLDTFLGKLLPVYRNNMIRLVWGFQK